MEKPRIINPALCNVSDFLPYDKNHNELYKDTIKMDYWWGVLELAGSFDYNNFVSISGKSFLPLSQREISYLQLLHYTIYMKLAGAHFQIEQMQRYLLPEQIENYSSEHRAFMMKECFDALHSDLYQSITAFSNELYILLNRSFYVPTKVDETRQISMSPSDLLFWLKTNNSKYYPKLRSFLLKCEKYLDIRHHLTHYGVIPVSRDPHTGNIFLQQEFSIGKFLTKFDLMSYHIEGNPMISANSASEIRILGITTEFNNMFQFIYLSTIFEDYLEEKKLKLIETWSPYWEKS